jgi:hypothetical protein
VICEIEFLPVGTGSKAGDAIILRYGTPVDFNPMNGPVMCFEQAMRKIKP